MRSSLDEFEAAQVIFGPAGLKLDHAAQGLGRERVAGAVEAHCHPTAVGVAVALVTARGGTQAEAVADERGDDLAGGEAAQALPVEPAHTVTGMRGSRETWAGAGTGPPSSTSSATISSITSRMCVSASSRL